MAKYFKNYIDPLIRSFLGIKHTKRKRTDKTNIAKIAPLKLKLIRDGSMAYWGDQFLAVKGKQFDILKRLAQKPGEIVLHRDLFVLIESEHHRDPLLRQYINSIRRAFPPPYNNPRHPKSIIKTRKMEGYYLNLHPNQVEII